MRGVRPLASANSDINNSIESNGASEGTRTPDLRFTKPMLYQLSYAGKPCSINIYNTYHAVAVLACGRLVAGLDCTLLLAAASTARRFPSSVAKTKGALDEFENF